MKWWPIELSWHQCAWFRGMEMLIHWGLVPVINVIMSHNIKKKYKGKEKKRLFKYLRINIYF